MSNREILEKYINDNLELVNKLYNSSKRKDVIDLINNISALYPNIERKQISKQLKQFFSVNTIDTSLTDNVDIKPVNTIDTSLIDNVDIKPVNTIDTSLTDNVDIKQIKERLDYIESLLMISLKDKQDIEPKSRFTTYLTDSNREFLTDYSDKTKQSIANSINHIIKYFILNHIK